MAGVSAKGILERLSPSIFPTALSKYLFCCPSMDLKLRCLPRTGGLYAQRQRDMIEFGIIENRIIEVMNRRRSK